MWKLKQSGQFKKDLRKYQNDREKMKSLERVLVQLSQNGKVDNIYKPHRLKG
ncbi:MAG: type II toxin-antitoxin system YafQ family toxin [Bacteroidaceae bacterium]|nr:type II toxin-antitoxin system YafQ family toxin [Bacteroidaceae bacterium]